MRSKLMCPACGWLYDRGEYPAALSPDRFVPHHEAGGGWCPGAEQTPRYWPSDGKPLWNGKLPPGTTSEQADEVLAEGLANLKTAIDAARGQ